MAQYHPDIVLTISTLPRPRLALVSILTRTERDFRHLGDLGRCKVRSPWGSGMGGGADVESNGVRRLKLMSDVCLLFPPFSPILLAYRGITRHYSTAARIRMVFSTSLQSSG